ncbi:unnamed protein product [Prunus armeniaca]
MMTTQSCNKSCISSQRELGWVGSELLDDVTGPSPLESLLSISLSPSMPLNSLTQSAPPTPENGPGMETKRTTAAAGQIQNKAVAIAWFNPPGGVWQDNNTNSSAGGNTYCTHDNICSAGTSVVGSGFPKDFLAFVTFNTVSFIASLSVTLLLVGGFPSGIA